MGMCVDCGDPWYGEGFNCGCHRPTLRDREKAEIKRLRKALEEIKAFGKANPGMGHSCFKMAEKALNEGND